MSYHKPAVCASFQTGRCHAVTMDLLSNRIEWIAELPDGRTSQPQAFTLNSPAHDVKIAEDGKGRRWAVTSENGNGVLYDLDGGESRVIQLGGVGAGQINIRALPEGCEVLIANQGPDVTVYDTQGRLINTRPMPYASEGIHHVEPDGRCISEDQARGPIDAPYGAKLYRYEAHDGRVLGQLSDLIEGVGLLQGGELYKVQGVGYNDQSSHFVVSPITGNVWIAIPGHDTPAPHQVVLERITKPQPQPEPVKPPVIIQPPPVPNLDAPITDHSSAIVNQPNVLTDYTPPPVPAKPEPIQPPVPKLTWFDAVRLVGRWVSRLRGRETL